MFKKQTFCYFKVVYFQSRKTSFNIREVQRSRNIQNSVGLDLTVRTCKNNCRQLIMFQQQQQQQQQQQYSQSGGKKRKAVSQSMAQHQG